MQQFAKVLPLDLQARRSFVQSGSLQKIQEVPLYRAIFIDDSLICALLGSGA